ncbi:MAG: hypothetical protein H7222_18555 [Methylotenera sp.]|nr:hypothetical protein [Oligoflexia bacterium]
MPRQKIPVKRKLKSFSPIARTGGIVDLHFHGAFGVDLMSASRAELNRLSLSLWKKGVAGFCATTLSATHSELMKTVTRLGAWIRSGEAQGALPLGIHLEGPYVHPHACGAHPVQAIREFRMSELEELWEGSQKTLKILTLAPEILAPAVLRDLTQWAKKNEVILSLGHSRATESEAGQAFKAGFTGVTHAWNALPFHHRSPGPLGAAFGRPGVYVELILDQIHVNSTVIRWTRKLHPKGVCFVSDCAPAAATTGGRWVDFGILKTRFHDGACRLKDGSLAGGGLLLGEAYRLWLATEARETGRSAEEIFKSSVSSLTVEPLRALGISARMLSHLRVQWTISDRGQIRAEPL